jgi:hypothetical protein
MDDPLVEAGRGRIVELFHLDATDADPE